MFSFEVDKSTKKSFEQEFFELQKKKFTADKIYVEICNIKKSSKMLNKFCE